MTNDRLKRGQTYLFKFTYYLFKLYFLICSLHLIVVAVFNCQVEVKNRRRFTAAEPDLRVRVLKV